MKDYLEKVLRLKVNEEKSAVDRPWKRKFLGFSFTFVKQTRVRIHPKSLLKLKEKIRTITNPVWSISIEERIERLNQYLMGWIGYFALEPDIENSVLLVYHTRKQSKLQTPVRVHGVTQRPLIYIKPLVLPIGNTKG